MRRELVIAARSSVGAGRGMDVEIISRAGRQSSKRDRMIGDDGRVIRGGAESLRGAVIYRGIRSRVCRRPGNGGRVRAGCDCET